MSTIRAVDLFCGGGGTSHGLARAAKARGRGVDLLAINHWNVAIETHRNNHPWARHLCDSLDNIDPKKVIKGSRINLLVASPECTHHSIARGGKPISDQSRASAWHVVRWASDLYIDNILIENVKEFRTWGPLGTNGRPLKSKRGQTFQGFTDALKSLGYKIEHRVLNCADYGDPTTRERLFMLARRGTRPISWPEATHAADVQQGRMFGSVQRWRPARDIIDWDYPSQSIFTRKKPLAPATIERIAAGLERFGGKAAEPFIVILRNNQHARSIDSPLPTVITENHTALVRPFVIPVNHGSKDLRSYAIKRPFPTVTTVDAWGVVEPMLVEYNGTGNAHPVSEPAPTITAKDRLGLVTFGVDIHFRMLQPHELAAAMGFPADYRFAGTREQKVRQIGNAVPVNTAEALCRELIA